MGVDKADAETEAKQKALSDIQTQVVVAEQELKAHRIQAANKEDALAKSKLHAAKMKAEAVEAEDILQRARLKKDITTQAYVRASLKASTLAESAQAADTEKNQVEAQVEAAEKQLEQLKPALAATPAPEPALAAIPAPGA